MKNFEALGLTQPLLDGLAEMGFENPTEIQQQAIPILLKHDGDFIGLAQTGTGKTAAFGIPLLELMDTSSKDTQALILAPTRELAQQICRQIEAMSQKWEGLMSFLYLEEQISWAKLKTLDVERK